MIHILTVICNIVSNGTSVFMLKPNAQRRRSKLEIEEAKEEQRRKEIEI